MDCLDFFQLGFKPGGGIEVALCCATSPSSRAGSNGYCGGKQDLVHTLYNIEY